MDIVICSFVLIYLTYIKGIYTRPLGKTSINKNLSDCYMSRYFQRDVSEVW